MKQLELSTRLMQKLISDFQQRYSDPSHILTLDKDSILKDQDICQLLTISVKTLRKFRNEKLISYIKLGGTYYYYKPIFILDLLRHCSSNNL